MAVTRNNARRHGGSESEPSVTVTKSEKGKGSSKGASKTRAKATASARSTSKAATHRANAAAAKDSGFSSEEGLLQALPTDLRQIARQALQQIGQQAGASQLRSVIRDWNDARDHHQRDASESADDAETRQALASLQLRSELRSISDPARRLRFMLDLRDWLRGQPTPPQNNRLVIEFLGDWQNVNPA